MITENILPNDVDEEARDMLLVRQTTLQTIKNNLKLAQERMKKHTDKRRTERVLEVGDMAYLKVQPYKHNALGIHKCLKLHSKFYETFKVIQKIGQVAYKLLLPKGCAIHPVFHISQLKKHLGPKVIPQEHLPLVDSDGNILMQPESLFDQRMIPHNNEPVVQWLIKWINLPETATTWDDIDFIRKAFPNFNPEDKALEGGSIVSTSYNLGGKKMRGKATVMNSGDEPESIESNT